MAALIPVVLQLLLSIIKWVIDKYANDKELEKAFAQFADLARSENIKTIQRRNRSEKNQIVDDSLEPQENSDYSLSMQQAEFYV